MSNIYEPESESKEPSAKEAKSHFNTLPSCNKLTIFCKPLLM